MKPLHPLLKTLYLGDKFEGLAGILTTVGKGWMNFAKRNLRQMGRGSQLAAHAINKPW